MNGGKLLGAMIGAGLGLALGSAGLAVLFGLVGAAIGHVVVDAKAAVLDPTVPLSAAELIASELPPPKTRAQIEREARALFGLNVLALFERVARATGRKEDVRASVGRFLVERLAFSPEEVAPLSAASPGAVRTAEEAARMCREELSAPERMLLLDALYALAAAGGRLTPEGRDVLAATGAELGLSEAERASVARLYLPGKASDYALLGIGPEATDDEVKRAFRRLAVAHHPDKVSYLGGTAVFRASETFRAIREAYEAILAARGL